MEEKLREVSNQELIQIYMMIVQHLEFLEGEKLKVEEVDKK